MENRHGYLKPIVTQHFTYIKDSQHLIQILNNKKLKAFDKLHTGDFESLYTNITIETAIQNVMELFKLTNNENISCFAFYTFLKLVLLNNYFYYKNKSVYRFFLQIKGVSIGTSCGPSIANLHLAFYEIKYKSLLNSILYFRFIDDVFFVSKYLINDAFFQDIYPHLKLNIMSSNVVNFLDLNISIDFDYSLIFNLYIKPTNTQNYFDMESNNVKFIFDNIPRSLIHRIRRICTNLNDYYYHSTKLHKILKDKGYQSSQVKHLIRVYANMNRVDLIPYKLKQDNYIGIEQ
ncbi:unnamed protein product [Brachionus calyciflorus]|uniref:Reverse transcriptase domain-containing protein n=1 Tax=Brachionus calyciflorus TaxID=104777 RepID=A0A813MAK8_9BILA|nr:unnamed protein product [Brachionus calyciflorus]